VKLRQVDINQSEQAIHESLTDREITPLIITKDGKAVAALVPLTNTDIETASLSLNSKFLSIIERSRSRLKAEGGVPSHLMEGRFR
jgi:hypothetical protein